MSQYTAEQRLVRTRVALVRNARWRYLSGVLFLGEHSIKDNIPTACTDGRNARYGRKFVESLTDDELQGVVLHETFHIMYRHLYTWKHLYEKNAAKANAACDYVINLQIKDAGALLPAGALLDEKYRGMDAGQVFVLLDDDPGASLDEHDWEGAENLGAEAREQLAKDIDQALREGAIQAAREGLAKARELTDLLSPKLNWREILAEFVSTSVRGGQYASWRRPQRRHLHSGLYLPSTVQDSLGHVVVAADMSGSVGRDDMMGMLTEMQAVAQQVTPARLDVLYWDSSVRRVETYEGEAVRSFVQSTQPMGGGGTRVAAVFDWVREAQVTPDCLIILTDGYTTWPASSTPYPVLVIMTTDQISPIGVTVRL